MPRNMGDASAGAQASARDRSSTSPNPMEESPAAAPVPRGAAGALRAFLMMLARENLVLATSMGAVPFVAQVMAELTAESLG